MTYRLLEPSLPTAASALGVWRATGGLEVKGKGLMETHLWSPTEALLVPVEGGRGRMGRNGGGALADDEGGEQLGFYDQDPPSVALR